MKSDYTIVDKIQREIKTQRRAISKREDPLHYDMEAMQLIVRALQKTSPAPIVHSLLVHIDETMNVMRNMKDGSDRRRKWADLYMDIKRSILIYTNIYDRVLGKDDKDGEDE